MVDTRPSIVKGAIECRLSEDEFKEIIHLCFQEY
jgi:hypothetical protein